MVVVLEALIMRHGALQLEEVLARLSPLHIDHAFGAATFELLPLVVQKFATHTLRVVLQLSLRRLRQPLVFLLVPPNCAHLRLSQLVVERVVAAWRGRVLDALQPLIRAVAPYFKFLVSIAFYGFKISCGILFAQLGLAQRLAHLFRALLLLLGLVLDEPLEFGFFLLFVRVRGGR